MHQCHRKQHEMEMWIVGASLGKKMQFSVNLSGLHKATTSFITFHLLMYQFCTN